MRLLAFLLYLTAVNIFGLGQALADDLSPRTGWQVHQTEMAFPDLVKSLKTAVKEQGFIVVTQAGPTRAAAARGIVIPNNMVIGVFNNDFAVRILETSTAAMIEAPVRFYLTETADGTTTLSYKTPSHVFAPYVQEGGPTLQALVQALDVAFAAIASSAISAP